MPYQVSLLAPNLLHVEMSGHVDASAAEDYYAEAWQKLNTCPKPTYVIMDARTLESTSQSARDIADRVRNHPHVGIIAFLVKQRYLLLFSPILKFFSNIRMFGSDQEAIDFLKREGFVSQEIFNQVCPVQVVPVSGSEEVFVAPTGAPVVAPLSASHGHGGSPSRSSSRPANPVSGVFFFVTDMIEGMTRKVEDKPYLSE